MRKQLMLAIALAILAVVCGGNKSKALRPSRAEPTWTSSTSEVSEGIDINKNPWEAIQKAIEIGQNLEYLSVDVVNFKSNKPISFKHLIEVLPQLPAGWTATDPRGQTISFGNYSVSEVEHTYSQGDKKVRIKIIDCAYNSALYAPFLMSTEFSQESTEGYNKGIKIGDILGREEYDYGSQSGSLNLLAEQRFFIQINGDNLDNSEQLREWWQAIDLDTLSELVK